MIDKELLVKTVEDAINGTELFVVDIAVKPDNNIVVELDSVNGVDIDTCVDITRRIESVFDRDVEDYQLEVGSAGLTSPFKVKAQYVKNIGNDVEVLTRDGRKLSGRLVEAGDETFTVEVPTKVKHEGAKRPVIEQVPQTFGYADCKSVTYRIDFR
jgi:ribosome maturation factor RimP